MFAFLPCREIEVGDLVRLMKDIPQAWAEETATVVAIFRDYDVMEVAFDQTRKAVLYGSDEDLRWERFEPAHDRSWRVG